MKRYKEVSAEVFDIFYTYSNKVEALSVDEAFIDLSDDTEGLSSAVRTAEKIRSDIRKNI